MIYVKPNGAEIDIHERSIEYAKSLGWKPKVKTKPKPRQKG